MPKGRDEIKEEVITKYGFDPESQGETIDKITNDLYEDNKKLSTAIGQKRKVREELDKMTEGKDYYKKLANTSKEVLKTETNTKDVIAEQVFIQNGGDLNKLRNIKKVMKGTGKSFAEAQQDYLITSTDKAEEQEKKRRDSQLRSSSGGTNKTKLTEAEKRFENLPTGFKPKS